MIDLNFTITPQNYLQRTDSHPIKFQVDEEYICHFTFENEKWDNVQKFVTFTSKKKKYTSLLTAENGYSSAIPYEALMNCIINISVHGDDIITKNQISLVVSQPKEEIIYKCTEQENYHDVYAEAFNQIKTKFDRAELIGDEIVFYANGKEISRVSLGSIGEQVDWQEQDETSTQYIRNKPDIIDEFRYENDNLLCLSDNEIKQSVSLKHNHPASDIVDFDEEVDIDLNNLLANITENIRSL